MIFVTVGSQLGFDRLVHAVDAWAKERSRDDVFAQVGDTSAPPQHIPWTPDLAPADFEARVAEATLIVGHAGTGTIMAALTRGVPVITLARREALGETRNDHQVATLERFAGFSGFHGTTDESNLAALLDQAVSGTRDDTESRSSGAEGKAIGPHATGPIVDRLRDFLDQNLA